MNSKINFKKIMLMAMILILLSCAFKRDEGAISYVPKSMYGLNIHYDEEELSFHLVLKSFSEVKICMSEMRWPDSEGRHYLYGDREVYFINDNIRYDLKDEATGYCTAKKKYDCTYRLKKNEELLGKLSIKDFTVDSEIYLDKKFSPKLEYPYAPYFCP